MSINGKHTYRFVYLHSETWASIRLEALVKAQGKCAICEEESIFNDAHHVFYPKSFWDTTPDNLVILCRACHTLAHACMTEVKGRTEGQCWTEWKALVTALGKWRTEKNTWVNKPGIALSEGPKQLRMAYEELKSKYSVLASSQRKAADKHSRGWCFCCHEESPDTTQRNIMQDFDGDPRFWSLCAACWDSMQGNIEWPKERWMVFPAVRAFLEMHRRLFLNKGTEVINGEQS